MAATSPDVLTNPCPTEMSPYRSLAAKTPKAMSPARRVHHLAVPERAKAKQTTLTGFNGTRKAIPALKLKPESPVPEIRDSLNGRSVRPRSGRSRDSLNEHTAQVPDRTKSSQTNRSKDSKDPSSKLSTQNRHDVARPRRTAEPARTAYSIGSIGAWSEPSPYRAPRLLPEASQDSRAKNPLASLPTPPMTPNIGRLGTPELAPMAFDVEFCVCCPCDEQDRVSDTWYLAGRDKYDVQLDDARAYIAKMNARVDRLLK